MKRGRAGAGGVGRRGWLPFRRLLLALPAAIALLHAAAGAVRAEAFFEITSIKYLTREPMDGTGAYWEWEEELSGGKSRLVTEFRPCIEVGVRTRKSIRSGSLVARCHIIDGRGRVAATIPMPSLARLHAQAKSLQSMPAILRGGVEAVLYFVVPGEVCAGRRWSAVVVFGDRHEMAAGALTAGRRHSPEGWWRFEFPEREAVERGPSEKVRRDDVAAVMEEVVHTRNETQPQITLLARVPEGCANLAEVRGVLAMCVLANSVEDIRQMLMAGNVPLAQFADQQRLAVLAWGSRRAWELAGSYHEFDRAQNRRVDVEFDKVAAAWERGVKSLGERHGLPQKGYLFWACSGAANWAHRLALRRPEYFRAVHVEILSTHDRPTPDGVGPLWLVTTGELEGGYESSLQFYRDCRALGYPILYKAYPGVGHSRCPEARALGVEFFRYALDARAGADGFERPAAFGDIVNQEAFEPGERGLIPEAFRTPLPTRRLAELWDRP